MLTVFSSTLGIWASKVVGGATTPATCILFAGDTRVSRKAGGLPVELPFTSWNVTTEYAAADSPA
jgi:hypothetical protein